MFTELGKNSPVVNYTENFAETLELCKSAVAAITVDEQDVNTTMNNLQNDMETKFGK